MLTNSNICLPIYLCKKSIYVYIHIQTVLLCTRFYSQHTRVKWRPMCTIIMLRPVFLKPSLYLSIYLPMLSHMSSNRRKGPALFIDLPLVHIISIIWKSTFWHLYEDWFNTEMLPFHRTWSSCLYISYKEGKIVYKALIDVQGNCTKCFISWYKNRCNLTKNIKVFYLFIYFYSKRKKEVLGNRNNNQAELKSKLCTHQFFQDKRKAGQRN